MQCPVWQGQAEGRGGPGAVNIATHRKKVDREGGEVGSGRWAKNGNCIDVITCAANYLLKSINQHVRQRRTTGRMSGRPSSHPPAWQLLFYASLRWQQIIVMFLSDFAHNSAVLRGRCWAIWSMLLIRPVLPVLHFWNEPRSPQIDMPWHMPNTFCVAAFSIWEAASSTNYRCRYHATTEGVR